MFISSYVEIIHLSIFINSFRYLYYKNNSTIKTTIQEAIETLNKLAPL